MTTMPGELVLQQRWRLMALGGAPHLLYYGIRNPPHNRTQCLPISPELAGMMHDEGRMRPETLATPAIRAEVESLWREGVLVDPAMRRTMTTAAGMQTCVRCVNNDYIVPGLEFDAAGVCALCQCYAQEKPPARAGFSTVTETDIRSARRGDAASRFDAMVLYTGGKDSSYMLWLLARKLKLRVLAAFWNMPYCSAAARQNIVRAQQRMGEVEFVEWTLPGDMVRDAMRAKWHAFGWPCLCPTAAFPTLYPLAAHLRIPFVFLGLEDVQTSVMDYVFPPAAGAAQAAPTPREQTLASLRARSAPRPLSTPVRWMDEMSNYHAATVQAMPGLFRELSELTGRAEADPSFPLPLLVRLATNEAYGTWGQAREIIEREMGWLAPEGQNSLLHTSCAIEPVKDYLQFQRFRHMRTVFMPQSIIETSAAVFFGMSSREEALAALPELGYWQPPAMLDALAADLGITPDAVIAASDELPSGMTEWATERSRPGAPC